MGRRLQRSQPCIETVLIPKFDVTKPLDIIKNKSKKKALYYNHRARIVTELQPQQRILIRENARNWTPARIIDKDSDSDTIRKEDGEIVRKKNRINLWPLRSLDAEIT